MSKCKKMLIPVLCAAALAFSGCSGKKDSSEQKVSKATVKPPVEVDESTAEAPSEENVSRIGPYLQSAYDIMTGDKYTYKCTLTSTENDEEVYIERYKSGVKLYQAQTTSLGRRGFLADGTKVYEFDYHTYSYTDEGVVTPDVIESVVKENLSRTDTHVDAKDGEVAEEYTYMGDTYITVYDFYFDEKSGALLRYTATYSVEGNDDIIETRILSELLSSVADDGVFTPSFTATLTDFSAFSQTDRQTYCSDICSKFGITEQMMISSGLSTASFKKISYDDFIGLVYRYSSDSGDEKQS